MKKTLLITHVDLDGVSPIILLNLTGVKFEYKSVEITDLDDTLHELIDTDKIKEYEQLYITDLTVPEWAYEYFKENNINIKIFDHHETHLYGNNYPFATVKVNLGDHQTCGTELFYEYLKNIYPTVNTKKVKQYVDYVTELDTWHFTSDIPKELDSLKNTYGTKDFIKTITRRLKSPKATFEFTAFEKKFTKLKKAELQRYMEAKEEKMLLYEINGKKCGVLFAEKNKSELGNYISVNHPELDLVIMLDASSRISYRTNRDDVSVSEFATIYGGGGHQKASGSKFDDEDRNKIIEEYFKGAKRLEKEEEN